MLLARAIWFSLCFSVLSQLAQAQGVVTDRLLVLVNGHVITESDVRWALALDPEVEPLDLKLADRKAMLDRLIDQHLLDQEAEKLPRNEPSEEDISEYISNELIKPFKGEARFRERMAKAGLDQGTLREIVRHRLEIVKYIDFRFRSFIFLKPEEVERYYQQTLVPRFAREGAAAPVLDDQLRAEIERRLTDERVNSELDRFFDETRAQAQITRLAELK